MNKTDLPLFSEFYTCYYQVVAKILHEAALQPLTRSRLETLARTYGYDESALAIVPRLLQGDWPFLCRENTSPPAYSCALKNPVFPQSLTKLQKSWQIGRAHV